MKSLAIKKHQMLGFIFLWAVSVCSFLVVDLLNGMEIGWSRVVAAMGVQAVLFASFVGIGVILKRWRMARACRAE